MSPRLSRLSALPGEQAISAEAIPQATLERVDSPDARRGHQRSTSIARRPAAERMRQLSAAHRECVRRTITYASEDAGRGEMNDDEACSRASSRPPGAQARGTSLTSIMLAGNGFATSDAAPQRTVAPHLASAAQRITRTPDQIKHAVPSPSPVDDANAEGVYWKDIESLLQSDVLKLRVIDMFRILDKDNDGVVTLVELQQHMAGLGASHLAGEIASLFKSIDMDGDRLIRYTELDKWVRGGRLKLATELRAQLTASLPGASQHRK